MRYLASHENAPRGSFDFPVELYQVDYLHPRYEMPFHWHMEYEVIRVLEGAFHLFINGEQQSLNPGEAVFIPEGAVHGGAGHHCKYECLVFDLEYFLAKHPAIRQKYLAPLDGAIHNPFVFRAKSNEIALMPPLFETIRDEKNLYELAFMAALWQLLLALVENPQGKTTDHAPFPIGPMKNVLRLIREEYAAPLTLTRLAQEASMAPRYFCRAFAGISGRPPMNYVNYYRIECAAEKLYATEDSITDVALSCGFNDLSYFSKLFKRQKGLSPRAFRQKRGL